MRDFIIVAPAYIANSNGIKTLHKICNSINKLGGTARLMFIDSNDPDCATVSFHDDTWTNKEWNTPPLQESERHLIDTSYVLYPEVMLGNPLGASRVIRYFGNREAYCNGKMIGIGANDFLLAHSLATRKDAHYILFNSEINPAFHNSGTVLAESRTLDLTYVGKGYLYGKVGIIAGSVLIGRDWPTTQDQLAILLRHTRLFHTWDAWTSTNVEAILCGAIPYFIRYDPWTEEDLDTTELGKIPRLDTNNKNYDPIRFEEARNGLRRRIDELTASWDTRVKDFMSAAEKHFVERGNA